MVPDVTMLQWRQGRRGDLSLFGIKGWASNPCRTTPYWETSDSQQLAALGLLWSFLCPYLLNIIDYWGNMVKSQRTSVSVLTTEGSRAQTNTARNTSVTLFDRSSQYAAHHSGLNTQDISIYMRCLNISDVSNLKIIYETAQYMFQYTWGD